MFETQVITDLEQFKNLREEWNRLLQRSYANTIFLTWEWLYTWWEVFGGRGELFIITVRNEKKELIGIAPLYIRKTNYYKFPVKQISFIGTGLSDRQDFIVIEGNGEVLEEIISKFHEAKNKWDITLLEQIPNDSKTASSGNFENYRQEMENSSLCPYVKINGAWESYFKNLSKNFRRDIQKKTNRINKFGKWEFKTLWNFDNPRKLIESMVHIEMNSRKDGTEKMFFSIQANKEFFLKFSSLSMENGWLDFSTLSINGAAIAYLLGFTFNNKYYAYNTSYVKDYYEGSPGKLLINQKIKWCYEQNHGPKEFDFLRGDHYIKSLWASESRQHIRMVFFNGSVYSELLRLAVFRVRPFIMKYIRKDNKISSDQD